MWTDTPKRVGVETLLARNDLTQDGIPRRIAVDYNPAKRAGSSLDLSDGRIRWIGVLSVCRLETSDQGTRKTGDSSRLPSTSRGWHGAAALYGEIVVERNEAYERYLNYRPHLMGDGDSLLQNRGRAR